MSVSFVAASSAVSSAADTQCDMPRPAGLASGDLLVVVLGFEDVAAGSGPWTVPRPDPDPTDPGNDVAGPSTGWIRVLYQEPSATGAGLEVWAALHSAGTHAVFRFNGTYAYVARTAAYRNEYTDFSSIPPIANGTIRGATSQPWTGNNPQAPAVTSVADDLVIICAAEKLQTPGYTAPPGFAQRFDNARAGIFGNVEITLADESQTGDGAGGPFPFTATAATGASKATTATLAIRALSAAATPPAALASAPLNFRYKLP